MQTLLDQFLTGEVDDFVRSELLEAIEQLQDGQRYFTYNAINVLLDGVTRTATIDDELDVSRTSTLELNELQVLLMGGREA